MASPTVRNSTRTAGASSASETITKPTGAVDGDIILIGLYKENTAAVTLSGFTLEATATVTGTQPFNLYIFSKRASGEGATWSASWTGSVFHQTIALAIQSAETSGGYTTGTPDAQIRTTTATRTFPDTSLTTATADTLMIWFGGCINGISTGNLTPPTGYATVLGGTGTAGADIVCASKAEATIGAKSVTGAVWVTDGASSAASTLISIKSPGAGGGASLLMARVPNNCVGPQVLRALWRAPTYPFDPTVASTGNRRRRAICTGA